MSEEDKRFVGMGLLAFVVCGVMLVSTMIANNDVRQRNTAACEAKGGVYVYISPGNYICYDKRVVIR